MAEKELAILVVARGIQKATGQILTLDRKLQHLGKATRNASANLQRGIAIAATAAGAGIAYSVKQAGDFEAQLLTINTIARETTDGLGGLHDGLDGIGDGIRRIARETGSNLTDLTTGYYDILSAGITDTAAAQNVLAAANTLGIGALASTAQTVDLLTTAINAYGRDATQAGRYADIFAKSVEMGKVTADEIAASFADVAPVAATLGIEIEEIGAAYAALTAQGVPAAAVTTQMQRAILTILQPNKELNALQKETGKNFLKIAKEKGLVVALQAMRDAVGGNEQAFKDLFGRVEGYKFALQTTGAQQETYNTALAAMDDAAGTAAEQAAERQKGLNFQLERLKANVRDAAITVGTELIPVFADLAEEAVGWIQGNQGEIKQFAKDLGSGAREAVKWLKGLNWTAIIDTIKAGAGFVGGIVTAFVNAPPWVQQFLATGFLANKFTGGVIGDVMGDVAKGVIRGVLGINAGVVNVHGKVVNGAGGAGGAAGGVAGGGMVNTAVTAGGALLAIDALAKLPGALTSFEATLDAAKAGDMGGARGALEDLKNSMPVWMGGTSGLMDVVVKSMPTDKPIPVKPQGLSPDERAEIDQQDRLIMSGTRAVERSEGTLARQLMRNTAAIRAIPSSKVTVNTTVNVALSAARKRATTNYRVTRGGTSNDSGRGLLE